jgi:hypothetical protein
MRDDAPKVGIAHVDLSRVLFLGDHLAYKIIGFEEQTGIGRLCPLIPEELQPFLIRRTYFIQKPRIDFIDEPFILSRVAQQLKHRLIRIALIILNSLQHRG